MIPAPRRRAAPYFTPVFSADDDARLLAAMERVATERNLLCPEYDDCLTLAGKKKWPGFDCMGCAGRLVKINEPRADPWARPDRIDTTLPAGTTIWLKTR